MARPKKESHPITIRIAQELFDRLNDFCDRSGLSKTVAIERALTEYINAYDKLMKQAEMK